MDEKERIEREALTFFLRLYNRQKGTKFRFWSKRERPDFEVRDLMSRRILGVEVSHIFHDKKEAMMILGRDPSKIHGIITMNDHMEVLKYVLRKKAEKVKYYPYDGPILLVIRDYSPTFNADMLFTYHLKLEVPPSNYKEIWYMSRSQPVRKWDMLVRLK